MWAVIDASGYAVNELAHTFPLVLKRLVATDIDRVKSLRHVARVAVDEGSDMWRADTTSEFRRTQQSLCNVSRY